MDRDDFSTHYFQTVKLLRELKAAYIDGSYEKMPSKLAETMRLIFDDGLLDSLYLP